MIFTCDCPAGFERLWAALATWSRSLFGVYPMGQLTMDTLGLKKHLFINTIFSLRQFMKFEIQGQYIELLKLLKASGLCSTGGMAKVVITDGQVQVDGNIELRKRRKLKKGQQVEYAGNVVEVV
jgi:ribosome-associated protein